MSSIKLTQREETALMEKVYIIARRRVLEELRKRDELFRKRRRYDDPL